MAQTNSKPKSPNKPSGAGLNSGAPNNRVFVLSIIGIVVLGLAAVAYFASTRTGGESTASRATDGAETAAVTTEGEPLTRLPEDVRVSDETSDPDFGQVAPTLTGTGFDGGEVTIGADGSPKVVYFLAHWCSHCQAEVPLVQQLIEDGRVPEGLDIYGVSTAVDSGQGNYPPSAWLDREGFGPTVVRDDADSSGYVAFGGGGFPYVVYLDGENRVVARSSGSLDADTIEQLWGLTASQG